MWRALSVIEGDQKENPKLQKCLAMFANRFLVWQKAWQQLCEEYGVDGDGVLGVHPAWNTVQELADLVETFAISPMEAAVWVNERDEGASLVTSEQICDALRKAIEARVRWWT